MSPWRRGLSNATSARATSKLGERRNATNAKVTKNCELLSPMHPCEAGRAASTSHGPSPRSQAVGNHSGDVLSTVRVAIDLAEDMCQGPGKVAVVQQSW